MNIDKQKVSIEDGKIVIDDPQLVKSIQGQQLDINAPESQEGLKITVEL